MAISGALSCELKIRQDKAVNNSTHTHTVLLKWVPYLPPCPRCLPHPCVIATLRTEPGYSSGCRKGGVIKGGVYQKRKISPKRKFSAGRPCEHPAKNFGQGLQILGKQAFWHGHAARTSTKKLRSEKLWADFSFPSLQTQTNANRRSQTQISGSLKWAPKRR